VFTTYADENLIEKSVSVEISISYPFTPLSVSTEAFQLKPTLFVFIFEPFDGDD
jgi:hypothetical protein